MRKISTFIFLFLFFLTNPFKINAQGCQSKIEVHLKHDVGADFSGLDVKLIGKLDNLIFLQKCDSSGIAKFTVPCNTIFTLSVSNFTDKFDLLSLGEGEAIIQTLLFESKMVEVERPFQMSVTEITKVDKAAILLPDTIFINNSAMTFPANLEAYVAFNFIVYNDEGKPLAGENISITGIKRNKTVKGVTDTTGKFSVYLLKGDEYSVNFKYHPNFYSEECKYTIGHRTVNVEMNYTGTSEIERLRAQQYGIRNGGIQYVPGYSGGGSSVGNTYLTKYTTGVYGNIDTVVTAVLNRNAWKNKLIVCDLTGSMEPYASQLALWYKINLEKEQNLQFVFFNDGNNIFDSEKTIGETGGIYYSASEGLGSLATLMARVSSRGDGGDVPENNMEAIIEGAKLAKPFDEIVMIVDNYASVRDIKLVYRIHQPVHIILCGATEGWVHTDYLLIAWKTKGSIHTIEEDITEIGSMINGQEIEIEGTTYRLMDGNFVMLTAR